MTGIQRICQCFIGQRQRKKFLAAFLTAGDPDIGASLTLCQEALQHADLLELGIPFSDPMADGPVIQASYKRALSSGVRLNDILGMVRRLRAGTEKPILFMVYLNIILQRGVERFIKEAAEYGVDGLIIPDLPPEEADKILNMAHQAGLGLVFLVAPTSTKERIRQAAAKSCGFLYCVSLRGVTGARAALSVDLSEFIQRIRNITDLPLAVGFGISGPEQVRKVSAVADGAIVGSALIQLITEEPDNSQARSRLGEFLITLKTATLTKHEAIAGKRDFS